MAETSRLVKGDSVLEPVTRKRGKAVDSTAVRCDLRDAIAAAEPDSVERCCDLRPAGDAAAS
jgi:hypothetical protein